MGACATKPKVLKHEGDAKPNPPEREPEKDQETTKNQQQLVHVDQSPDKEVVTLQQRHHRDFHQNDDKAEADDQSNKRHSLSLLFKRNEDGEVETENGKAAGEETTKQKPPEAEGEPAGKNQGNETVEQPEKQGTSETEKPPEDDESNKQVKQEAPEVKEQRIIEPAEHTVKEESSKENQGNESVEQDQEPMEAKEQSSSNEPAEQQVKQERSEAEAEKPSEGNQSNEAVKQESREAQEKEELSEADEKPSGESEINDTATQEPQKPIDSTESSDEPSKDETSQSKTEQKPSEDKKLENPVATEAIPPTELANEKVIHVEVTAPDTQKVIEKSEEKLTEEVTASTQEKKTSLAEEASKAGIH